MFSPDDFYRRLSGSITPPLKIRSSGRYLHGVFSTDSSVSGSGFYLSYATDGKLCVLDGGHCSRTSVFPLLCSVTGYKETN